jgi:ribosomal protein S12 methylthiotransferase accessory factor YcaO
MLFNQRTKSASKADASGKFRDALNRAITEAYDAKLTFREVAKELQTRAEVARSLDEYIQGSVSSAGLAG